MATNVVVNDAELKALEARVGELTAQVANERNMGLAFQDQAQKAEVELKQAKYTLESMHQQMHRKPGVALNTALAAAQGRFRTIGKNAQVEVTTTKGGQYKFKYATLADMWDVIRTPLAENGLSVMQFPSISYTAPSKDATGGGLCSVETMLLHSSGEQKTWTLVLPFKDSDPKSVASIISYAQRYSLRAGLGITSAEDVDLDQQPFAGMEAPPPLDDAPAHSFPAIPPMKPPAKPKKVSSLDLAMDIQKSANKAELQAAAVAVADALASKAITPQQREDLVSVYKAREAELAIGKPDTITPPKAEVTNFPKAEPGSEG